MQNKNYILKLPGILGSTILLIFGLEVVLSVLLTVRTVRHLLRNFRS